MDNELVRVTVNKKPYTFSIGEAFGQIPNSESLLSTLRERLGLTGTKKSCGEGACGCCTVIMNGNAVTSCIVLTCECDGADIVTIEGLEDPKTGELDVIQQQFIDDDAFQCGYCTPGIIMTLRALLDKNPNPTMDEVKEALAGNYCRCISHYNVFEAVEHVIEKINA
ncbi:MAG: (2Fe-2S)-binding protein [Oscillospiraceae bacterium]|nr:(2Fe-2S)-binding protein [Oscillospiraceae bacterium]